MKFITANSLIEKGIPSGLFWNTANKSKPIERDRMIVHTLKRGYNERILAIYVDMFGATVVKEAISKQKKNLSRGFYTKVHKALRALS